MPQRSKHSGDRTALSETTPFHFTKFICRNAKTLVMQQYFKTPFFIKMA